MFRQRANFLQALAWESKAYVGERAAISAGFCTKDTRSNPNLTSGSTLSKLISEEYKLLNCKLHSGGRYGLHGEKWAAAVKEIFSNRDLSTVLDYGCGQGSLGRALGFDISEYDPAMKHKCGLPGPADLVVCTDVLEHIEPTFLENVLAHLASLTREVLFAVISTREAVKILEDGRNAHLIVWPAAEWRCVLEKHFSVISWEECDDEIVALMTPVRPSAAD